MKPTLILALLFSLNAFAHEGHGVPGATPPAPHGGALKEAEHTGSGHAHGKGEESELFFEAVYKDNTLKIYPLTLTTTNPNAFTAVSPKKELTNIVAKIEIPRTRKTETITLQPGDDAMTSKLDLKGTNRFFVYVSADYKKEAKAAKIQLEVGG